MIDEAKTGEREAGARELERDLRSGERQGFEAVYRAYSGRVLGFAIRLCGNRAEAEDLVQETFLAAYGGRTGYRGRSGLLTWLLGIASRRWRDGNRKQRVDAVSLDDSESPSVAVAQPDDLERRVTDGLALSEALNSLDEPFRQALLLVASQGLTYREAAEVTGEPVGTVKWRVFEATRRMRRILGEWEEESDELQRAKTTADRGIGGGTAPDAAGVALEASPLRL
jgi:RNA polymerase sigma-70 factor, ECF subfamily